LFGHRTLGFLSNKDDDKEKRWTRNPWVFDNNYYNELLDNRSPYLKTPSDKALLEDDTYFKWVQAYANDQQLFFDNFAEAYIKVSELGTDKLLDEEAVKINYV
jgi:catalase (peroxidase I)